VIFSAQTYYLLLFISKFSTLKQYKNTSVAFNKKINYVRLLSCDYFLFLKNLYLSEGLKQNFESII